MRSLSSALGALSIVVLTLMGCERLNPSWCDEYAQCEPHEYCDPASNTCKPRDAGPPRFDGLDLHPAPLDRGPDQPWPKQDKGPDGPRPDVGLDHGQDAPSADASADLPVDDAVVPD